MTRPQRASPDENVVADVAWLASYWDRHDTICERHAHHALLDAIVGHQADKAATLMTSHLVDLLSGLDLTLGDGTPRSLADILR